MPALTILTEHQSIPTSGARAVEPFVLDGMHLLAVPQLSYDSPHAVAGMNGGDSDTELLLLRRERGTYRPFQVLPAPGGEDAEFFRIGARAFLAVASIRSGKGPYRYTTDSVVHEWNGREFVAFQRFETFAAKQWRHFEIAGRHFLALAQGVVVPGGDDNRASQIYEWDGRGFVAFQEIPSQWAYNWHAFEMDGTHYLAHADHVQASTLYRWNGHVFEAHQELADRHGRAFAHFIADGAHYLLVARLESESQVLLWTDGRFRPHQTLPGAGAREFAVVHGATGLYVVRINFLLGTRADPRTALDSEVYRFDAGRLSPVQRFPTTGATDAAALRDEHGVLVAVSHSLTADVRFAARTVLYRFHG